jgi:hypothetical protein
VDRRPLPLRHSGRRAAAVLGVCLVAATTSSSALTSTLSGDQKKLPAGTLRGPIDRLQQYPTLSLATSGQRAAAVRLLEATRRATRAWRDPKAAAAAGFKMKLAPRLAADRSVTWFHSENYPYLQDDHFMDPQHIETPIYANAPGRPLVLIGVMFALRRGMHGVSPGGPITRWHMHWVCARGKHRGVAPRRDGSCPRGTRGRYGSEMMHIWFTHDLRSAYAVHAPEPELCVARLLPSGYCHRAGHHVGHH